MDDRFLDDEPDYGDGPSRRYDTCRGCTVLDDLLSSGFCRHCEEWMKNHPDGPEYAHIVLTNR